MAFVKAYPPTSSEMPGAYSDEAKRINALINRAEKEGTAATLKSRRTTNDSFSKGRRLNFDDDDDFYYDDEEFTARTEDEQLANTINRRDRARSVGVYTHSGAEEMDYMMSVINAHRAASCREDDRPAIYDDDASSNDSRGNSSSNDSRKPTGESLPSRPSGSSASSSSFGGRPSRKPSGSNVDHEADEVASLVQLIHGGPPSRRSRDHARPRSASWGPDRSPAAVRAPRLTHLATPPIRASPPGARADAPPVVNVRVVAKDANQPFGINHAFFYARDHPTALNSALPPNARPPEPVQERALELPERAASPAELVTSSLHGDALSCLCNLAGLKLFHLLMRVCKDWHEAVRGKLREWGVLLYTRSSTRATQGLQPRSSRAPSPLVCTLLLACSRVVGVRVPSARAVGMGAGKLKAQWDMPTWIDMMPDGNLLIVDSCNYRLKVLSVDGRVIRSIGRPGAQASRETTRAKAKPRPRSTLS